MRSPQEAAAVAAPNRFYFTAWRWHFYAGLYVIPFLLMLATTGLIMLWTAATNEINGDLTRVAQGDAALAISELQAAAEVALPEGAAMQYLAPLAADRVALFRVDAGEVATVVLIDPYTATVVDQRPWRGGLYDFANKIHGTLMIGTVGDRLIEMAASLGILLVVSGLYLHFPRNGGGLRSLLLPRFAARGRTFWKSLHGVVGFWISALLILFLISGLSWSGIWGERFVQAWSTFPAEKWDNVPLSDDVHASMNHGDAKEVPWALEHTHMPASGSLVGQAAVEGAVTIDSVAAFAQGLGFNDRFQITLPKGEAGVWTISHDSMSNDGPDPAADRTIHIDRFTGNVLADVAYADYSVYGKAMAWGIAFHEGDMGWWNVALNTVFCLSVIFISLTGLVMWWIRRPAKAGRIAAPPRPAAMPFWKGALVVVIGIGLLFPLAGMAMLAAVLIDTLVLRFAPPVRRVLS